MWESAPMGDPPERHSKRIATLCRRRDRRIPLSVEVELSKDGLTLAAVIRDVSFSDEQDSPLIGIGLFHNDALPLDETLHCRTISPSELLPIESTISLMWTCHFGSDGFLSGGRMSGNDVRE